MADGTTWNVAGKAELEKADSEEERHGVEVSIQDEVPSEFAAHYVERDDAWLLDADGVAELAPLLESYGN